MQSRMKDVLFKVTTAVVCILAYAMSSRLESTSARPTYFHDQHEDLYGVASKAILKSGMWSSDKTDALRELLSDAPDGYYQSIIAIVNSGMWSSDKLRAIKRESAKFADFVQI